MATKSKNVSPIKSLKELESEISYNDFNYKKYFHHLCDIIPEKSYEKLTISPIDEANIKTEGLVYVFAIENKIFKIGHTIKSIKDRIQSYNCGKTEYRIKGTCSTANYFVLQSLLNINKPTNVYAFFPEKPRFTIFGKKYIGDSYPPSKRAEKEIITNFKNKFNKKPIGCTQS